METVHTIPSPGDFVRHMAELGLDQAGTVAEDNEFLASYFSRNASRFYETLLHVQAAISGIPKAVVWDIGAYPGTLVRIIRHYNDHVRLVGFGSMMPNEFVHAMNTIDVQTIQMDIDPPYSQLINDTVSSCFFIKDDLPTPNVVIMGEILEHLFFPQHILSEIFRKLAPSGVVVVTTPNITIRDRFNLLTGREGIPPLSESHIAKLYEFRGHVRIYCRRDLFRILRDAGFDVVAHRFVNLQFQFGHHFQAILKRILYLIPGLRRDQIILCRKP